MSEFPCDEFRPETARLDVTRGRLVHHDKPAILVVDGSAAWRIKIAQCLENIGWRVFLAPDGGRGIELFRAADDAVAAAILDYHLPDLDGYRVLFELRRIRAGLPVVICANHDANELSKRYPDESIVYCLPKPFTCDQLATAIRAAGCRRRGHVRRPA
jgi:two-component system OmpR family response regulator